MKWNSRLWLPALLAVAGFAACVDQTAPTAVRLEPVVVQGARGKTTATTSPSLHPVAGRVPADSLVRADSAIVSGGNVRIYVAGNELTVPGGAVREPTMFKMRLREDGIVGVILHAYQQDAQGNWTVDVGPQGFSRPVQLVLSYEFITQQGVDVNTLQVAWDRPDGRLEPVTSWVVKTTRDVYAELNHFSDYALVVP